MVIKIAAMKACGAAGWAIRGGIIWTTEVWGQVTGAEEGGGHLRVCDRGVPLHVV